MGVYSLPDELRPSQPSPSPSPLALQAGPGGILGCPCVANKLEEIGCLVGGGGGHSSSRSKAGIGAARVHAVQAHICPATRTPTHRHTHAYCQSPPHPSCLNFPLFPRGSPDLWHGGASHGAPAPAAERSGEEPHTNLCQLCSPFLAPRFEIY